MEMGASPPAALDCPGAIAVVRRRPLVLELRNPAATPERLTAYLSLRDRPVQALLARDRLERLGSGHFLYRSRPFRLLRFELVPTLELRACWRDPQLEIVCETCRIVGLGPWERALAFEMGAELRPAAPGLEGEVRVTLHTARSLPAWGRALAGRGLDQVLERIQRRVGRGLRADLLTWLLDTSDLG
jgi:hypothetical protein